MLKMFKKATTLVLILVLLLAMSATVFAVDTWSHTWTASDDVTTVEYYATINARNTQGTIDSMDNQGEVTVNADIYFKVGGTRLHTHSYDNGVYYASVYEVAPTGAEMSDAAYSFYAYVGSTGEEFPSGTISLTPTP